MWHSSIFVGANYRFNIKRDADAGNGNGVKVKGQAHTHSSDAELKLLSFSIIKVNRAIDKFILEHGGEYYINN